MAMEGILFLSQMSVACSDCNFVSMLVLVWRIVIAVVLKSDVKLRVVPLLAPSSVQGFHLSNHP